MIYYDAQAIYLALCVDSIITTVCEGRLTDLHASAFSTFTAIDLVQFCFAVYALKLLVVTRGGARDFTLTN